MAGPRLTAPAAKLVRCVATASSKGAVSQRTTIATSSKAAAPLMRKYADLLKERNLDGDRHIYTRSANRPHPPPQRVRLMQTFSSSAPRAMVVDAHSVDHAVLPPFDSLAGPRPDYAGRLRVPILPDNFVAHHAPEVIDEPLPLPEINVVAANPDKVYIAALTEVEGMTLDGVELKFAHEGTKPGQDSGILRDLGRMTF